MLTAKIIPIKGNITIFVMWPFEQEQQSWGSLIVTGILIDVLLRVIINRFQLRILTGCFNSVFLRDDGFGITFF